MDDETRTAFLWLMAGMGTVGLTMLILGIWRWRVERAFVARARQAPGTVLRFDWRRTRRRRRRGPMSSTRFAHPVVRYRPDGGDEAEFVSHIGANPPAYREGETVTVLYDPADRAQAMIAGPRQHALPLFLGGIGAFFCLLGGGFGLGALLGG